MRLRPSVGYRLPAFPSSFVGHERDVDNLIGLISTSRLVTLAGIGGVGKTRLAGEVARRVSDEAFFIDVGRVASPELVIVEVASAFGVGEGAARTLDDAVADRIGRSTALLVLDGCEHVIDECADVVSRLIRSCPGLVVLATSRRPLGVPGETSWTVAGLQHSEAGRLFRERALAVRPDLALGPDKDAAVDAICRRLDGLPLAIELAASRIESLSIDEIAERLEDRFALLRSFDRTQPSRHRSLQATLDWSFELLDEPERRLLRRLSVFSGTATLAATMAVCDAGDLGDEALDTLSSLIRQSLVVAEIDTRPATYRLLDTIREYAAELLSEAGETEQVSSRHARWCIDGMGDGSGPCGAARCSCSDHGGASADDVRAALAWSVEAGRADEALRLAAAQVPRWWAEGSYSEARHWLQRALDVPGEVPAQQRAGVLGHASVMATMLGDLDGAIAYLDEELRLSATFVDDAGRAQSICHLGFLTVLRDPTEATELLDESVALARKSGDEAALAFALHGRARARMFRRDLAAAVEDFADSVEVARLGDDLQAVVSAIVGLAWAALILHDLPAAEARLDEVAELTRDSSEGYANALAVLWRAELSRLRGEHEAAEAGFTSALAMADGARAPYPRAQALIGLGRVHHADGDGARASARFDDALSTARSAGIRLLEPPCLQGLAEVAREEGDIEAARRLFADARHVSQACGDAVGMANAIAGLAGVAHRELDRDLAIELHREALDVRDTEGDLLGTVDSLEALAVLAVEASLHDRAVRLFAAAQALRDEHGLRRAAHATPAVAASIAEARRAVGARAFRTAWEAGSHLSRDEATAYARRARGKRARGRPDRGVAALTPVERSVVDLAAAGLTNPEIAERLFISRETVKSHLSSSFGKLGVRSRRELPEVTRPNG